MYIYMQALIILFIIVLVWNKFKKEKTVLSKVEYGIKLLQTYLQEGIPIMLIDNIMLQSGYISQVIKKYFNTQRSDFDIKLVSIGREEVNSNTFQEILGHVEFKEEIAIRFPTLITIENEKYYFHDL